jgi:hypothetical protein
MKDFMLLSNTKYKGENEIKSDNESNKNGGTDGKKIQI